MDSVTSQRVMISMEPLETSAILVMTHRTGQEELANLSYLASCSRSDLLVYIGDNSASPQKHQYLRALKSINPHVQLILHPQNVGGYHNILSLLDASSGIDIITFATDDDRVSLSYIDRGIKDLRANPDIARSAGLMARVNSQGSISQDNKSALSSKASERFLEYFDPNSFNQIFYSTCRRPHVLQWVAFRNSNPLPGIFFDFLTTLSTLAHGQFVRHTEGHHIYFSNNWDTQSENQNSRSRSYEALGLPGSFSIFHDLHFGVECVNFLLGRHSPISDESMATECARISWNRCAARFSTVYRNNRDAFLNLLMNNTNSANILDQIADGKEVPVDIVLDGFIGILSVFSTAIAGRYRDFLIQNYQK
jgi:hypothetical protein